MDLSTTIEAKAQELYGVGQAMQQTVTQKQAEANALQKEIAEINQSLLMYEGAYNAYKEMLAFLNEEANTEQNTSEETNTIE